LIACYYEYDGMGPPPGATSSVTFFSVVPQGDYVRMAELKLGSESVRLCFDGTGKAFACQ